MIIFNVFLERVTSETKPALGKELGLSRKFLLMESLTSLKVEFNSMGKDHLCQEKVASRKNIGSEVKAM